MTGLSSRKYSGEFTRVMVSKRHVGDQRVYLVGDKRLFRSLLTLKTASTPH